MYASALTNPYQIEHNELFKAIRSGKPINSGDYMARSTLIGHHGPVQLLHRQGSHLGAGRRSPTSTIAPKPEDVRADMEPPVKPDAEGIYPVFTPGVTKLL